MYKSVLAALLMGMLPVSVAPIAGSPVTLEQLAIAPPAEHLSVNVALSASGVLIIDRASGQQVFGFFEDTRRPMASLTKLMTALIIAETENLDDLVKIPQSALAVEGNRAYLPAGELFTVGDLLTALLVASANDAAHVLALYHSGSIDAFVEEMNARAQALGLHNTHYANPAGLDSVNQWSTPQDIAWLTTFVMSNNKIASRMSTRGDRIYSANGQEISLSHTHALMHADTPVFAGKTGTTLGAKECVVSVVKEGDKEYVVVIMHSDQRYADLNKILQVLSPTVPIV